VCPCEEEGVLLCASICILLGAHVRLFDDLDTWGQRNFGGSIANTYTEPDRLQLFRLLLSRGSTPVAIYRL